MKIHECEQGDPTWIELRLGRATASRFDAIITPAKLQATTGKGRQSYIAELLAEWMLNAPIDDAGSGFMERGKDMELEAVRWYEADRDVDAKKVGFCTTDDGRLGCSPDRLIGEDGGLEIKVPSAKVHVHYLLDPAALVTEYKLQVLGNLWITGRSWWDLMSYNPVMPNVVERVTLDEELRVHMDCLLGDFLEELDAARALVYKAGGFRNMSNPFNPKDPTKY